MVKFRANLPELERWRWRTTSHRQGHLADSRSRNTQRAYARQWDSWTEWARSNGLSVLPASTCSVAAYLVFRSKAGATESSVKLARTAIAAYHKDAGQPDPTAGEQIRRVVACKTRRWRVSQPQMINPTPTIPSVTPISEPIGSGRSHPLPPEPCARSDKSKGYDNSEFLTNLGPRQKPYYVTDWGEAWVGDSRKLLKKLDDESIDLVVTSPPYGLLKKKEYGNERQDEYVKWFRPFAKELYRVLKSTGSLVMNIGGAWQKGQPTRAMYPYRLMLDLCEPSKTRTSAPIFHLAQEFYWLNPAKIPNPVQWANVTRERVKDAVEPIWWLSKAPHPKANNRKVLVPYSEHMQRLLKTGKYNSGPRPSGWNISEVWGKDNGGAIPSNFESSDALNYLFNILVVSNTSSNDTLRRTMKEAGSSAHPAMFPNALPEFFIQMLTDEGDVVLDPFAGSNSTGWVADNLRRKWVAMDINEHYVESSRLRWTPSGHQQES